MADRPILSVAGLTVAFGHEPPTVAVRDVSFDVRPGDSLGIVGESGCGKSTLVSALLALLPTGGRVTGGTVTFDGTDLLTADRADVTRIRWRRLAAVFQNSMTALNPVQRVGNQMLQAMRLHTGLGRADARAKCAHLFEVVGIDPRRLRSYPHELSGGMRQRAAIALALCCEPEVLIADEPTTALDVVAQKQVLDLLAELRESLGLTLVMVSHDLGAVADVCQRVAVLYAGSLAELGDTRDVFAHPRHPYTQALVGSYPKLTGPLTEIAGIRGVPPHLAIPELAGQCAYAPRCDYATERCVGGRPEPLPVDGGRLVACANVDSVPAFEGSAADG